MRQYKYTIKVFDPKLGNGGGWTVAKSATMSRGSAEAYLRGVRENGYRARLIVGDDLDSEIVNGRDCDGVLFR